MAIKFLHAAFALALTFTACAAAAAAPKAAPTAQLPTYDVKGFRGAHFGQTQEQVIGAILHDLGVKAADVQHLGDPVNGTTALAVTVPQMPPAPGPATVTYVFGKPGLIHVNVVWLLTGEVPAVQRAELIAAGLKLSNYFRTYRWEPGKSAANIPIGPNSVSMFLGKDAQGNAVEVSADGVSFQRTVAGKAVQSPTPSGPARLRVAYGSVGEVNAVTTIKPGQF
jgi:hypothetical protein